MKKSYQFIAVVVFLAAAFAPHPAGARFPFFQNAMIGKAAPDFTFNTSLGKKASLQSLRRGKNTIVFLWATWCPHCGRALQGLEKNKYTIQKKGIKLVLVDLGEDKDQVSNYLKRNRLNFEVLLDENSTLYGLYGVEGIPTFIFIDKKGIIKAVQHSLPSNYEEIFG